MQLESLQSILNQVEDCVILVEHSSSDAILVNNAAKAMEVQARNCLNWPWREKNNNILRLLPSKMFTRLQKDVFEENPYDTQDTINCLQELGANEPT